MNRGFIYTCQKGAFSLLHGICLFRAFTALKTAGVLITNLIFGVLFNSMIDI